MTKAVTSKERVKAVSGVKPSVHPVGTFGSLTVQAWRGSHFKFSITEPEGDCALPVGHVQAEMLQGDFSAMVDDVVAGGMLPLEVAANAYERYADMLRAAADEMESAARVFTEYAGK